MAQAKKKKKKTESVTNISTDRKDEASKSMYVNVYNSFCQSGSIQLQS